MNYPYKFVIHESFQLQLDEFMEKRLDAWTAVVTACKKIAADPFNAGGRLQGLKEPLAGNVLKVWVKGRRGYRLIYLVNQQKKIVMGIYLSTDERANFDYSDLDWQDYAQEIYTDLVNGNEDMFKVMRLPR